MLQLSHTAFRTKARVEKVKHDFHHIVLQVNYSKPFSLESEAQCTQVKGGAVYFG